MGLLLSDLIPPSRQHKTTIFFQYCYRSVDVCISVQHTVMYALVAQGEIDNKDWN